MEVQVETRISHCGTPSGLDCLKRWWRRGMLLIHGETGWFRCPGCESPLLDCALPAQGSNHIPIFPRAMRAHFQTQNRCKAVLCQHHSFLFVFCFLRRGGGAWTYWNPLLALGVLGSKVCTIKSCLPALLLNVLKPKTTQLPLAGRKWPSSYVSLHSGIPLRNKKERTPWAHLCRQALVN